MVNPNGRLKWEAASGRAHSPVPGPPNTVAVGPGSRDPYSPSIGLPAAASVVLLAATSAGVAPPPPIDRGNPISRGLPVSGILPACAGGEEEVALSPSCG